MSALAQDKRWWLAGGAVVAVLIVVVGWFFAISPVLAEASSAHDQVDSAAADNTVLRARNAKLKQANDNAATLRADLAAALAQLPSDSGLAEFTRQLSAQATANGVVLSSVVVGSPGSVAADPTTTTTADAGSTTGATASASATGLVSIPITVGATGPCSGDIAFLQAIQETGPRRALVSDVQLAPATGESPCTMTVQLTIFSAPLTPEDQAALEKLLSGG